jgi:hypothetical protein
MRDAGQRPVRKSRTRQAEVPRPKSTSLAPALLRSPRRSSQHARPRANARHALTIGLSLFILRCTVDDRRVAVTPPVPGGGGSGGPASQDRGAGTGGREGAGDGAGDSAHDSGTADGGTGLDACGLACVLPHASATCAGSACVVQRCIGAFRDANGQPEDGCEAGDIPENGLGLWFMADRGVIAQGGLVSAWVDQSSNGITATQPEVAARPGTATQSDGLPMLSFDGIDDALVLPSGFAEFDGAAFFAVVVARPNPLCEGILHFSNGAAGDDVEFGRHQGGVLHYEVGAGPLDGMPEAFVTDQRVVVSIVQAGSGSVAAAPGTVELRIDGTLDTVGFVPLPPLVERQQNFVGRNSYVRQPEDCTAYFRGLIAEVVFYPRGLAAAERERVEAYLREKWQGP